MAEQVAVGFARELANERGFVAEERAVVLANDRNVVANVVAVEVSEHHEQRLEHVGRFLGLLRVHEREQRGEELVVVNDQFAAINQRRGESKQPHVAREYRNEFQNRVDCLRIGD